MTLAANSVIHTLQGNVFALDLAHRDDPAYVYTWDGKRVTVGQIRVESARIRVPFRIELDDGSELLVSEDTQIYLRDGQLDFAKHLEPKTSLLPLYLRLDDQGYPTYREPGDWNKGAKTVRDGFNWRRVSRMVAEWRLGRRVAPGDHVSFLDKDRRNCAPENLLIEYRKPKPRKQKAKFAEPIFEAQRFLEKENHKIDAVQVDISREMFSIRGIGTSNLGVSGIFVSVDTE